METLSLLITEQDQDMELMDQARAGNDEAFDCLFNKHKQMVFNVCLGILGSYDDAIDATQITFIRAFRGMRTFQGKSNLKTWLYRIAVNSSIELTRKRKRRMECEIKNDIPETVTPHNDRVWEAILDLAPDVRAVLVLFYFQGLSGRELAQALGCSEGTARVRLHRAREAFKKKYEEVGK